nr:amino acid transporter AVT3A-like [Parasteatoda tepidariorum]
MVAGKGYSLWTAAVFMVSFNAGLGLLALPHALAGTGWFGIFLILWASINSCYCAVVLGETWLIMEKHWEEYRGKFRYPYPAMGMRTVGLWMRFAGLGALVTMVLACLGMFVGSILDLSKENIEENEAPTFSTISLSFGTMIFSFGGIFFFPTVQNDMEYKKKFSIAVLISYATLLILYIPVTVVGYFVYGSDVKPNLILSIGKGGLRTFIEICLAIHTFLAFLLGINPVYQEIEEAFNVAAVFNYKRCLIRSSVVLIVLIIACTIPHFDKVMNLVGGSTMTLLTFICPTLFYYLLKKKESKLINTEKKIVQIRSILEKIFLLQVVIMGVAGGIACTYFAILDIAQTFVPAQVILNNTVSL